MEKDSIVLLTCEGDSGRIAARYLASCFDSLTMIVEQPVSRATLLRRRVKRLGLLRVCGQLTFMAFQRVQQKVSQQRIAEIVRIAGLDQNVLDRTEIIRVPSVNSPETIDHLRRLQPRVILVVGTRIISAEVLRSVDAPFINYHAGITPKYRGVHGGYWAAANGDHANFGVTVHLVDEGIDTGAVLHQARITPSVADNYSTYPYLQIAAVLPLLERAAREAISGTLRNQKIDLPSHLWSHPTLWQYLAIGISRGAW
jgi:methionyl-tRNA formyltransferase